MPGPKHDIEETPSEVRDRRDSEGAPSSSVQEEEQEATPWVPAGEPEAAVEPAAPTAPAESDDHEAKLEHDLDELTAKAEKADEYLELAQRTKADFENYRKRAAREAAAAKDRGIAKLALELLPAVDNLDRALEAAEAAANGENGNDTTLASGIKLVHADVIAALARAGIERYSPQGERFDPQHHEAVAQQPVEGAEPGRIVEVYQRGYRLGDSVLRPARVVVAG
jgi:molecular chaperone GrpE